MLSFQRLDVYQRAIELLSLSNDILESLPRGQAARGDQLIRSAESIVRNISEGAGRWSRRDASKHYRIARGEAMEVVASLDVLKIGRRVTAESYERGVGLAERIVAMLTKLV